MSKTIFYTVQCGVTTHDVMDYGVNYDAYEHPTHPELTCVIVPFDGETLLLTLDDDEISELMCMPF